jgi:hypothetical protein
MKYIAGIEEKLNGMKPNMAAIAKWRAKQASEAMCCACVIAVCARVITMYLTPLTGRDGRAAARAHGGH